MIREVVEYHPNPRQKDGKLWCGHAEADVVIEVHDGEKIAVCRKCSPEPPPGPRRG